MSDLETKQGWKVLQRSVREGSDVYASIVDYHPRAVHYRIGEWARPKKGNGPLALFCSLEAAKAFARGFVCPIICRCEYTPSERKVLWSLGTQGHPNRMYAGAFPRGTVLANSVKLLEELQ